MAQIQLWYTQPWTFLVPVLGFTSQYLFHAYILICWPLMITQSNREWLTDWRSDSLIDTPRIRSSVTATSETAAFDYSCFVYWSQAALLNNNLVSKAETLANLLFIFKEVTIRSSVSFWLQTSDITLWRNATLFSRPLIAVRNLIFYCSYQLWLQSLSTLLILKVELHRDKVML